MSDCMLYDTSYRNTYPDMSPYVSLPPEMHESHPRWLETRDSYKGENGK